MNTAWTWASNVVEEPWGQLPCSNRAAQWPVTAIQLTARLCCREATGSSRSLPHMQTTLMFIYRHTPQPGSGSLQHSWTVWSGRSWASRPPPLTHRALITSGSPVWTHRRVILLISLLLQLVNQTHSVFTPTVAGERQIPVWSHKQDTICPRNNI